MEIEFAKTRDLPKVKELLTACGLPHDDMAPAHLLLRDESKLAGVIGFEIRGTSGLLRSLAVSETYRGQGIALYLTGKAEEYALSHGVEELFLLTLEFEGFFSKLGYKRIESDAPASIQGTKEYQRLYPTGAVCMVKNLTPPSFTNR